MNENRFRLLKADIKAEIEFLSRLPDELQEGLDYFGERHSYIELRAIGSILHDFYCGIENIFQTIAKALDGEVPTGHDWHDQLLNRMGIEIEDIRPAVISVKLQSELKDYLRFRHLFRNIYGFVLKWERMQPLVQGLPAALSQFRSEINSFFEFLDEISNNATQI